MPLERGHPALGRREAPFLHAIGVPREKRLFLPARAPESGVETCMKQMDTARWLIGCSFVISGLVPRGKLRALPVAGRSVSQRR